ncbi:cytochrome c oxidase assembly protein [Cobetia sp. L2A1]|uniref:cytochrome c oxidase assembly protein n=1 Tax=Cobetia sp. L2A1 TaxID=2686360 RepID=UPI00131BDA26|nr:cytochrome c oxidase assembly protein [Cobetia sp. L2A1]
MTQNEQANVRSVDQQAGVTRTVRRTLLALAGMLGFAFALVPLYDVFCNLTGLNGKAASQAKAAVAMEIDESRWISVRFIVQQGQGLPWTLEALDERFRIHPGGQYSARFVFINHADRAVRGRAVPSVSPSEGSLHLRKIMCFCFQEQTLAAGERRELPLVFQVDPDLPDDIRDLTLAYTLYPVELVASDGDDDM